MQSDIVQRVERNSPRQTQLPSSFTEIGRNISVSFVFLNHGPSPFSSGQLEVLVPHRSGCTRSPFLFYLTSVSVSHVSMHAVYVLGVGVLPGDSLGTPWGLPGDSLDVSTDLGAQQCSVCLSLWGLKMSPTSHCLAMWMTTTFRWVI